MYIVLRSVTVYSYYDALYRRAGVEVGRLPRVGRLRFDPRSRQTGSDSSTAKRSTGVSVMGTRR